MSRFDTRHIPPHIYAVTNYHVAVRGGASVIRINCHDEPPAIFALDPSDWKFVPNGDDIAVTRLTLNPFRHRFNVLTLDYFVRPDQVQNRYIRAGEDVFMVGRFMDHDGGEVNMPAVRFGHVSVMPTPIDIPEIGRPRDYYCVDVHSRSGFSGSPVFAYKTIGSDLTGEDLRNLMERTVNAAKGERIAPPRPYLGLLGIHCAQFPEPLPIERVENATSKEYVVGLSGMTLVAPSWAIIEAMNLPELQKERDALDAAATEEANRNRGRSPSLELPNGSTFPGAPRKPAHKR
jgi:hypothetical protein